MITLLICIDRQHDCGAGRRENGLVVRNAEHDVRQNNKHVTSRAALMLATHGAFVAAFACNKQADMTSLPRSPKARAQKSKG